MTLPAFDHTRRENQWIKPEVCLLEVRDRDKPDGERYQPARPEGRPGN